ncbi:MAG: HesA/MoeB/ThiF family protein [Chromatiales bacterium]|nr:HesA/MoeB/ThiF family protein [Chromatiales bacterium]
MTGSARYARHLALPQLGAAGQARLAQARVFVIGLGGLGSVATMYLAGAGTGHLTINDFDRVDETNLPRQVLFTAADIGRFKADATAQRLAQLNPGVQVAALDERLDAEALAAQVAAADLVLDCSDNFTTRLAINAACVRARRPLVSGAAIRFEGQVAVFTAPGGPGPCYRCLYAEDDENLASCAGQGIFAPVAGTIGAVMAGEALKLLAGIGAGLRDRLWVHDGLAGANRVITIRRNPECPACAR